MLRQDLNRTLSTLHHPRCDGMTAPPIFQNTSPTLIARSELQACTAAAQAVVVYSRQHCHSTAAPFPQRPLLLPQDATSIFHSDPSRFLHNQVSQNTGCTSSSHSTGKADASDPPRLRPGLSDLSSLYCSVAHSESHPEASA